MKPNASSRSIGSVDIELDWDEYPAGPNTMSPASGDATTLRSELDVDASEVLSRERAKPWAATWEGLERGTLIDGKYRIIEELGRGAMGVVMRAHDETLDRDVAVKLVQSHLGSPGFHRRFLEEGRAMARVNHRNVVQIYACGEHGSVPYMVMELVTGSNLEEFMARRGTQIDLAAAVRILGAVCEGVSAIHAADTLHRDIKPSNILLDEELTPRVADLGVSTFYRAQRVAREIVGTPAYMAPEVVFPTTDEPTTHLADVYSLGCVAYELLTGELPFVAENEQQWVLKHATVPPRPPSEVRPDLPAALDRVLLAALSKDPAQRTPTVAAFRRDLMIATGEGPDPVRILVAEDDDDFREVLELGLRREFEEAEIVCVPNGRAALEALAAHSASVAILDLNMPELGGFELTQQLRATESARTMPIIVLTGSGGPAEWRRLLSLGADRFLVKPVSIDDLVASVRHSLRERHKAPDSTPSVRARVEVTTTVAHESWILPDDEAGES